MMFPDKRGDWGNRSSGLDVAGAAVTPRSTTWSCSGRRDVASERPPIAVYAAGSELKHFGARPRRRRGCLPTFPAQRHTLPRCCAVHFRGHPCTHMGHRSLSRASVALGSVHKRSAAKVGIPSPPQMRSCSPSAMLILCTWALIWVRCTGMVTVPISILLTDRCGRERAWWALPACCRTSRLSPLRSSAR